MTDIFKPDKPKFTKTKAALLEYGWPDAFRKDDFNRDIDNLQQQWDREERKERREREAAQRQLQALNMGEGRVGADAGGEAA